MRANLMKWRTHLRTIMKQQWTQLHMYMPRDKGIALLSSAFAHSCQIAERELTHSGIFLVWVNSCKRKWTKTGWEKSNSQGIKVTPDWMNDFGLFLFPSYEFFVRHMQFGLKNPNGINGLQKPPKSCLIFQILVSV